MLNAHPTPSGISRSFQVRTAALSIDLDPVLQAALDGGLATVNPRSLYPVVNVRNPRSNAKAAEKSSSFHFVLLGHALSNLTDRCSREAFPRRDFRYLNLSVPSNRLNLCQEVCGTFFGESSHAPNAVGGRCNAPLHN